ncbi:MAG: tetratricopeptide repeat protein [Planctomycetaceae bacterium]
MIGPWKDDQFFGVGQSGNEFLEDRTYREIKERSAVRRWMEDRLHSLRTVTVARELWVSAMGDADGRTALPDELKTRLENRSGYASYHRDERWRKDIVAHYNRSLRTMIAMCREADVPVVLVRLGANLRDCPPFKSEHKAGLSAKQEQLWQQHFDRATAEEPNDLRNAIALYRRAEAIDGEHALLCYRLARCFDRLGEYGDARRYYLRAKDRDVCPLRILDEMADCVATIAEETGTRLIDAKSLFESQSPQQIPGSNFYVDHVHPTIGAQQQIAQGIVKAVHESGRLPKTFSPCSATQRRAAYRRHFRRLGDTFIGGARERVRWVEDWAQRGRFLKETLPIDRRSRLDYGHRWFELGDESKAWIEYGALLKNSPGTAAKLLDRALQLVREGRASSARQLLDKLRTQTAAEYEPRITLARVVVALEREDKATVVILLQTSAPDLGELSADDPWLKFMPDALERAKRIADGIAGDQIPGI